MLMRLVRERVIRGQSAVDRGVDVWTLCLHPKVRSHAPVSEPLHEGERLVDSAVAPLGIVAPTSVCQPAKVEPVEVIVVLEIELVHEGSDATLIIGDCSTKPARWSSAGPQYWACGWGRVRSGA